MMRTRSSLSIGAPIDKDDLVRIMRDQRDFVQKPDGRSSIQGQPRDAPSIGLHAPLVHTGAPEGEDHERTDRY